MGWNTTWPRAPASHQSVQDYRPQDWSLLRSDSSEQQDPHAPKCQGLHLLQSDFWGLFPQPHHLQTLQVQPSCRQPHPTGPHHRQGPDTTWHGSPSTWTGPSPWPHDLGRSRRGHQGQLGQSQEEQGRQLQSPLPSSPAGVSHNPPPQAPLVSSEQKGGACQGLAPFHSPKVALPTLVQSLCGDLCTLSWLSRPAASHSLLYGS